MEKSCRFTGHRIQKLPWTSNEEDERCKAMKIELRGEIEKAILRGYTDFVCGMAVGFDIICAETVLLLKKEFPQIKLIAALPCKNQDVYWQTDDKRRYRKILERADMVRCVYDNYVGAKCMFERNRYMVNRSSLVIALYNGDSGGTKSTVEYARKQGLEVVRLKF